MEYSTTQSSTTVRHPPAPGGVRRSSAGEALVARRKRWRGWGSSVWLLLLALPALPAGVVKIERISPPPLDLELPVDTLAPVISADGRFVAFEVGGEKGYGTDPPEIHVRDRQTGKTEPVGNGSSPAISADGRFVAFVRGDILLWDRQSRKTEVVSINSQGEPISVAGPRARTAISADGRFIVFAAWNDSTELTDIFVRDRQAGTTELVSVGAGNEPANGSSSSPTISADGRFVAFWSVATNLLPGDTNDRADIFLWGRQTRRMALVGGASDTTYFFLPPPAISADGRFVAFALEGEGVVWDRQTGKTERVGGDAPALSADGRFVASRADEDGPGISVWDRQTGQREFVKVQAGVGGASGPFSISISADGRSIAFTLEGVTRRAGVIDRVTGTTELLTASVNVGQTPLSSREPAISADGQWVVFVTAGQVFQRNRATGATVLVSTDTSGAPANRDCASPAISGDGRFVAFSSAATNLVPGDTRGGLFVRDRQTGTTERVADGFSASINADGRFVAFWSSANNLVPGDTNDWWDLFVWDRQTGNTELISVNLSGVPAHPISFGDTRPAISANGRFVAFSSSARDLVAGDTNEREDIFVRDRQRGTTELVSVATDGTPANWGSQSLAISADGRFVAFWSGASNLVPGDTEWPADIFIRDRQAGTTELVSVPTDDTVGNSYFNPPVISADGRFVAFTLFGSSQAGAGVFVRDRQRGMTERISVSATGAPPQGRYWSPPGISADGRYVVFATDEPLVAGDENGRPDVYVAERE